jgi:hypothetical protein
LSETERSACLIMMGAAEAGRGVEGNQEIRVDRRTPRRSGLKQVL